MLVTLGLAFVSGIPGWVPVHFDEAQYATWLHAPDLSYQTKGPLVTAVQGLIQGFGLPPLVATRLPAWFAFCGAGLAWLWLGRRVGLSNQRLWILAITLTSAPMVVLLAMVHTTDIWLLLMILVSLGAFAEVVNRDGRAGSEVWWVVMGAALGLGALAKLSIALIPFALMPWVVCRMPHVLRSSGPYLGAVVCALMMSPWITWNLDTEFAHFKHEFGHVTKGGFDPINAVSWLPILALSVIPLGWLAVFCGFQWRSSRGLEVQSGFPERVREAFHVASGVLVLFFVVKGLAGPILVNWVLPFIPFLLLGFAARVRWSLPVHLATAVVQWAVIGVLLFPYALGLSMQRDAFQKIRGWDRAIAEAAEIAGSTEVITTGHYSVLAWALYYWPDATLEARWSSPTGQVIPAPTRRLNQYDRWAPLSVPHRRIVHLGSDLPEELALRCQTTQQLGTVPVTMPDGTIRSRLGVWECRDYRPDPPWPPMTLH